jgi:hypothetical protein
MIMKMKKLLLAGGAAALMTASTAYSSIIDRPFFQVLGVVVVWGDDNGGAVAAPVVTDFVLLTPASGAAGADLIGDTAVDGSTVVTGTLTEVVGGSVQVDSSVASGDPISGTGSGNYTDAAGAGAGVLDASDTLTAFGIDGTTDVTSALVNTHKSSFYVASNAAFDIFAQATNFAATGDFSGGATALTAANITYAMSVDVAGNDGLAYGANAQDPSTGGTGVDATIDDLSKMSASTKIFDGGRRTASAVGGLASQSVRFDNTYTLDDGTGSYDLSMGVGTVTADVTFTIFVP